MELSKGYKRTEIGEIPENWVVARVEELVSISTGSKNTEDNKPDGQYPFFVRSQELEKIDTFSYEKEAVLTAGDGGTGKIFHYIDGKFDAHQRVYIMSDFRNQIFGKYFYWQFSTLFFNRIMSMTAKSTVDSVRREMIADMLLPLPPVKEQEAIAEALSDADALIISLEKLIEKKSAIYSRLNQVIFSKYINSSGAINKTLAHYGDFVTGVGFPLYLQGRYNGGIPFFKVSDFNLPTNDRTLIVANNYVARADLSELGGNLIKKGSLVFAKIGAAIFLERKRQTFTESLVDNNVAAYEVKSDITDSDFIYFLFNFLKLSKFSASSTLPVIDIRELAKLPISLPELEEQKIIALKLNLFYAEIKLLKKQLNKAKKIKAGMMQELLTGRTRLI